MNPFLHTTIARPTNASPASPARVRLPAAARLARLAGQIALAAGMMLGVGSPALAVDVNTATQPELESVRGIGPKTAELILRERQKGGVFKSFDDFSGRVRGIGAKRAQKLRDGGLTVGPSSGLASATTSATTAAVPSVRSAAGSARNTPRTSGGKPN